jgi:hypothetical protein
MKRTLLLLFPALLISIASFSQVDTVKTISKKGWKFGALPVVAYDADLGFQYGVLAQVNDFGDGTIYPDYKHMIYVEWSRYTKGTGVNQIFYDTKTLLPKHLRMTADFSFLTDKTLDFFGFNGYDAVYLEELEDDESSDYISRAYYKHERKQLRILLDFQGRITSQKFRWLAGISYYNFKIGTVDIDNLNKGKPEDKILPDTTLLYDIYSGNGLLEEKEADGGQHFYLKTGLIFDTRDNEPAPNSGIWEEVVLMTAPNFGPAEYGFARLAITHRHYVPLISKRFIFAYRLSYQGVIAGKSPFYVNPIMISSFSNATYTDGLGGAKSVRGVKRNRIVGDGAVLANLEFRLKIWQTKLFKQNFYIGATGFCDYGKIVQYRDVNLDLIDGTPDYLRNFDIGAEESKFGHIGYGAGLRFVYNDNMIVSVDYGFAGDNRDGASGFYFSINNLF